MYMYSERCIALFLFILAQVDGLFLGHTRCNYKIKHKCHGDISNSNVIEYNRSVINYCTTEDIPHDIDIHFEVKNLTGSLKIKFAPPKRECGLGIALLVNPLIKNEKECKAYNFEVNDINAEIHTIERNLCILRDTNQPVRNNKTSTSLCEDNIGLWFHHIFTGCYALRFRIDRQNVIRDCNFFYTSYQRTEVTEPQFTCKYDTYSDQSYKITNLTLDTSLPINTGNSLELALISPQNNNQEKGCIWRREPFIDRWLIHLQDRSMEDPDERCNINTMQTVSGKHIKTVRCNFQVQTGQNADYCFIFHVIDNRCHKNTVWKPKNAHPGMACTWIKRCTNISLHIDRIETVESNKLLSTNVLLPIIASILIVLVIGILGFWYLCIRKKKIILYTNPEHDEFLNSACFESTDLSVVDNDSEKEIDNLSSDDIVLLYTRNSMSFMTLMKDFRETLAKMCSCSVYDWYEEAEWNDVAKVGPVSWFTKLLNSKCRVVWIDTSITRSIVISRESDSSLKLDIMGDFRDTAFPVVLELAKRNINDTVQQYRRHFVVRFEGLESTTDVNDPFLDLSPHARYHMPQHLTQLCLDLSMEKPITSKYQMKAEENLLEQRLKLVKMESIM